MSSHSHVTTNVEIHSIPDDEERSVSSRDETIETLHEDEIVEYQRESPQVTTEDMIAEAIRGGPTISGFNMERCTGITVGNQTHIQGTVIIRNIMTRSEPEAKPETVNVCVYNKESDTTLIRQNVKSSKRESDKEFGKNHKSSGSFSTDKRKCIISLVFIILIISVINVAILTVCMFTNITLLYQRFE